ARVHLQVDIGFGDAITPAPEEVVFPTLLDSPAPKFRAYPKETVVSEKLEAMVQLGMANSRMKDFYDLVVLSNLFPFDGETLVSAIRATFTRRKTPIPNDTPVALTASFTNDAGKQTQWSGFVRKSGVKDASTLPKTASSILKFVGEPLSGAAADRQFKKQWTPGGEWI
ncbi:MAG TPA: nucleotidyl transferase AbiEii/AbiGii toxin family protein, partial [Polyangiaceae bacterium]|nr:nucleotidyl transferase AbiEii/AbiGii toxin family protein [Polyangiaceae bacterium]